MIVVMQLLQSVPLTLFLWAASQLLGIVLAVPIAAARMSRHRVLRAAAIVWIETLRGIPTLVLLFIVFFGLASAGFSLTSIVASILALGMSNSAYVADTIRAGFEAVPAQQREATFSLGLPMHTRIGKVLLPQAMPVIIEGVAAYSLSLLKETALASLIGVIDLMAVANYLVERGGNGTVVFLITGTIYLVLCVLLAGIAGLVGRTFTPVSRKRSAA